MPWIRLRANIAIHSFLRLPGMDGFHCLRSCFGGSPPSSMSRLLTIDRAASSRYRSRGTLPSFEFEALQSKKPFDSDVLGEFKQCVEVLVFAQRLTIDFNFEH
jgi:hypothetical protein